MKRAVSLVFVTLFTLHATLGAAFSAWAEEPPPSEPVVEATVEVAQEPTPEPEPVPDEPVIEEPPAEEVAEDPVEEVIPEEPIAEEEVLNQIEPVDTISDDGPEEEEPLPAEEINPHPQEPLPETEGSDPPETPVGNDSDLEEPPSNDENPPPPTDEPPVEPAPEPTPEQEPDPVPVVLPELLINEVMLGSEVNPDKDDWIEFYNPGNEEVLLEGWQIRGVTKGGTWIDITSGAAAVQPKNYYLLSHYTNSTSSTLAVKPHVTKTSIDFVNELVRIELKNPQGEIVDTAEFQSQPLTNESGESLYASYERLTAISDGTLSESWGRSSTQVNLKEDLLSTFATPGALNSHEPVPEPVQNLTHTVTPVVCPESADGQEQTDCLPGQTFLVQFHWENPESAQAIRIGQMDEWWEGWQELVTLTSMDEPMFEVRLTTLETTAFQFTTYDAWGRPSESEEIWVDFSPKVLINEFFADPLKNDTKEEFIELRNVGLVPVDLANWELATHLESETEDDLYIFADEGHLLSKNPAYDYILEPGEYFVLYTNESLLRLSNTEGEITLFDDEGWMMDEVAYAGYLEGYSQGRTLNHPDLWDFFFHPTPGKDNIDSNTPPVAVMEFQKSTYMTMNVTGENSYDADGDKLTFLWTGDEGFYSDEKNPGAFTFSSPGLKSIALTVKDAYGDSDRVTLTFDAKSKEILLEEELKTYSKPQLISEVMVNPEGTDDGYEWVELHNATSSAIDLSGWYLDDDENASSPEKIAEGTVLKSGQFLVIWGPGLSFKNSDDVVRLLDPNKEAAQIVAYTGAQEAQTYAKTPQGHFAWTPLITPGQKNQFPLPPKAYAPGSVTFERILPNPQGTDGDKEKVVIRNNLSEKIDLSGWILADGQDHQNDLTGFVLHPGQSLTLVGDEIGFSLNNSDESLTLYDGTGREIDRIAWKEVGAGQWLIDPDMFYEGMKVTVVRTVDGDTFELDLGDGTRIKSRLLGVDTPETVHPFKPLEYYGKQASDFLKRTLTGQTVTLRFDANKFDKYGRLLAYVYLPDGTLVNAQIIQQGYGYAYTRFPFQHLDDFVRYEEEAKAAGRGMWEHEEIREVIEEWVEEEKEKEEELLDEELSEEEFIVVEEVLEEEEKNVAPDQDPETEDGVRQEDEDERSLEEWLQCSLGDLKIDAFMPAPEKGKEEWIRLINLGETEVCLAGWMLDDIENGGSKPFTLKEENLAPGQVRTFYKSETKLNLNNKDDSVRLLNPLGKEVDRIDYTKTHQNEIFTHKGGDWVPKKRAKKAKTAKKPTKRHKFDREKIAYQYDWVNEVVVGSYELGGEGEVYILTPSGERLLATFLPGQIDWEMVEFLGESVAWEFYLHSDEMGRELVGLGVVS